MKKLLSRSALLLILFFSISFVYAQEKIKINETTKKYELVYDLDFSNKQHDNLFSDINEWLATNFNVEGAGLCLFSFPETPKAIIFL